MSGDFIDMFSRVSRASKEVCERRLQKLNVHVGQQFIMQLLWNAEDGLPVGEIAANLGLEVPTITQAIHRMRRQGLVEKYPHPTDARQVIIKLTERGWQLRTLISQLMDEHESQMLAGFSDAERVLLMRFLEQMLDNLEPSS
jgi:DNA-binding MarR family transcriptional regulator